MPSRRLTARPVPARADAVRGIDGVARLTVYDTRSGSEMIGKGSG